MFTPDIDNKSKLCYTSIMNEKVELYCTQNDEGHWLVWFPHQLGGMDVLETFDNEANARAFHTQQIADADYSA